jgi:hypothetical protein
MYGVANAVVFVVILAACSPGPRKEPEKEKPYRDRVESIAQRALDDLLDKCPPPASSTGLTPIAVAGIENHTAHEIQDLCAFIGNVLECRLAASKRTSMVQVDGALRELNLRPAQLLFAEPRVKVRSKASFDRLLFVEIDRVPADGTLYALTMKIMDAEDGHFLGVETVTIPAVPRQPSPEDSKKKEAADLKDDAAARVTRGFDQESAKRLLNGTLSRILVDCSRMSVSGDPKVQVAFIGIANRTNEELVTLLQFMNETVEETLGASGVLDVIPRNSVNAALREIKKRPEDLGVAADLTAFKGILEKQGLRPKFLLSGELLSENAHGSEGKDVTYRLKLSMADANTEEVFIGKSSELSKRYND